MTQIDSDGRPPIPADIKRRVLVEAGHRCAIPTCRYIEVELHHIIPWSQCRKHEYDNLIALCANCHRRADRGEIDRKSLHLYKYNLRFSHDKFSAVEMDILFALFAAPPGLALRWPVFNIIIINRLIEARYIEVQRMQGGQSFSFGMDTTPVDLLITDSGRNFVESLGLVEL